LIGLNARKEYDYIYRNIDSIKSMQIPKISFIIFGIFVTLMSTLLLLLLHPDIQVLAQEQFLTYESSELGISIQYPANWEKIASMDNFVTFTAPPETDTRIYPAALGLKVQELPSQNIALQEITKVQMSDLKRSNPGLKVLESTSTSIAGKPAHKIVFSAIDNKEVERKAMQVWTVIGNKAFLITYKAEPDKFSSYLPTIERMINSFKVIK
jgi:eukaryotic-like serine/threonine-protein kinase